MANWDSWVSVAIALLFLALLLHQLYLIAAALIQVRRQQTKARLQKVLEDLSEPEMTVVQCGQCDGLGEIPDLDDPKNWSTKPTGRLMTCPLCKGKGCWAIEGEELL